ncbi:MAG TPA: hypothetical protein VN867_09890 [Candidatus Binataceae bacterium]|nr:hypothetical protein [Candidatus Binataceae bacterium]
MKLEISVGEQFHANGVVEVARRFAVNGDDGEIAKITAPGQLGFCDFLFFVSRFGQNFVGKNVRQVMLANDDFDVHADFAWAAENFQDASDRREATFGITPDFDVYDRAVKLGKTQSAIREGLIFRGRAQFFAQSRGQLVAGRNQYLVQDARIVGENDVALRAIAEEADERGVLALDNLYHAAFGAAVRAAAFDAAQNAVAVHGVAQIVASNEKIAVDSADGRIRDEKGVAFAMGDDSAGDEVRILARF